MPDEPAQQSPEPRPVIPIEPPAAPVEPAQSPPPPLPIPEPGVVAPAPFAQVYAPASMTMSPPPVPTGYYPPAYPPPTAYPPPAYSPVDYRTAGGAHYGRPGFVTTLAVVGIIVASLSFLASVFSGCTGLIVFRTTSVRAVRTSMATTTMIMPPAAAGAGIVAGPDGFAPTQRTVIILTFKSRLRSPLTDARQRQFDAFLAEHGKLVFNDTPDLLVPSKLLADLGVTGQEFAGPDQQGADFLVLKPGELCKLPGRLRLFDNRAVFEPDDHSSTLRSSAPPQPAPGAPTSPFQEPAVSGFGDDEAAAIVNRVNQLSYNKLNPAQAGALTTFLQSPDSGRFVAPSSTTPGLTAQVKSAVTHNDGSMTVTFVMGRLTLDAQGKLIDTQTAKLQGYAPPAAPTAGPSGTSGGASTAPTIPGIVAGNLRVNPLSCTLVILEAALSALLAVYLLVVAILSLRQTRGGRRLLLIYAGLKLVCGVVAILGLSLMIASLNTTPAGPAGTISIAQNVARGFAAMAIFALVVAMIGMVFPLVVLMMLTVSPNVKNYYAAAG
ncbi:MAG TPA: hypothetical protein VH475_05970 [Tepidisphaeraceae bacterium]|jgi:hypothetical protein